MKRIYRFLGIALCSAMVLSLAAAAASGGQASGKSTLKLIGDRTISGTVTTTETKANASDVHLIGAYGKVTVSMDWDNIYFSFEKEGRSTTNVSASKTKDGEDQYSYVSWGTHVVMYKGDVDSSYTTSAAGPVDVFYNNSGRSNTAEELAERDAAAQKVYMETGIELESLSFVSFEYLWLKNEDELDPQYKPLKTFLIDEFILAGEGEGLPSGVYYDDHNAYIVRSLGDGKMRLVHSRIGDVAAQAAEDTMTVNAQDSERLFNGRTYSLVGTYDIE